MSVSERNIGKLRNKATTLAVLVLTAVIQFVCPGLSSANDCSKARQKLESKKAELIEYVNALQEFSQGDEMFLVALFSRRVQNLANQVIEIRRGMDCDKGTGKEPEPQVAPAKSEFDLYPDKSCNEIRQMLIECLRRINRLKRIKFNVFSQGLKGEKGDLKSARKELIDLKRSFRTKCVRGTSLSRNRRRLGR